ncbi:MAG: hypothetical protein Ct9H300mP31_08730 [Acidimicrobiaceae bacterium]|nr:MAG: hypothetical protein Ct9H300mP31_08730 [Acidimicrobiaceae bacterium]
MSDLVGERDVLLRRVLGAFPGSAIHVRGNQITIDGDHALTVRRVFDEVVALLQQGLAVDERTLDRAIDMVRADERPSEVLTAEIPPLGERQAHPSPVGGAEALRRGGDRRDHHLCHRPRGYRQKLAGPWLWPSGR